MNKKGEFVVGVLVFQIIFGAIGLLCVSKIPERSKAKAEAKKVKQVALNQALDNSGNGGYVVKN